MSPFRGIWSCRSLQWKKTHGSDIAPYITLSLDPHTPSDNCPLFRTVAPPGGARAGDTRYFRSSRAAPGRHAPSHTSKPILPPPLHSPPTPPLHRASTMTETNTAPHIQWDIPGGGGGYTVWKRVLTAVRPPRSGGCRNPRWLKKGGCPLIILYKRGAVRVFESNILHHITIVCIQICSWKLSKQLFSKIWYMQYRKFTT